MVRGACFRYPAKVLCGPPSGEEYACSWLIPRCGRHFDLTVGLPTIAQLKVEQI